MDLGCPCAFVKPQGSGLKVIFTRPQEPNTHKTSNKSRQIYTLFS